MQILSRIIWSLYLGAAAPIACAADLIGWTEEVKLSDGRIIQVQRRTELTESGFPVQKRGFTKYFEICYPPMNIRWKSKGGYQPDIFDIVDGKAYMHVPLSASGECAAQGYPSPNALYFVWEAGRWKRIAHEQFPEKSEWNLLMQTNRGTTESDPKGMITTADKTTGEWRDSSLRYEQKHRGWKRVNESMARSEGCVKWGTPDPTVNPTGAEIFIDDGKSPCGQ